MTTFSGSLLKLKRATLMIVACREYTGVTVQL
jgi:hypothetical protein